MFSEPLLPSVSVRTGLRAGGPWLGGEKLLGCIESDNENLSLPVLQKRLYLNCLF